MMAPSHDRTVLITGGTGFVGSHAVDTFLSAGYRVRCTVRATSNLRWLEGKSVELVEADLRGAGLGVAVAGIRVVVHCAGLTRGSSKNLFEANHLGTRALVDACLERETPPRFVLCSSQAAAGPGGLDRPRDADDPPRPISDYGASKLAAEGEVTRAAVDLKGVVLRPVAVYGPRDEDTLPFFRMAELGLMVIPGIRRRTLQLVHAFDLARALLAAAEREEAVGRTYFVAHPEIVDWARLAEAIGEAVGRKPLSIRVPSLLLKGVGAVAGLVGGGDRPGRVDRRRARDMAVRAWTCKVDPLVQELDWAPRFGIEDGLRDTVGWYRERGWLRG